MNALETGCALAEACGLKIDGLCSFTLRVTADSIPQVRAVYIVKEGETFKHVIQRYKLTLEKK